MKKIIKVFIISFFAFNIFYSSSFAHKGRLDKDKCHLNKKSGIYHCHDDMPKQKIQE